VRAGLVALIEAADDDEILRSVAAGPLEDFIADDPSRLHWIERMASSSSRFRQALGMVWIWDLPDRVFARVERAAGVALHDNEPERRARRLGRPFPPVSRPPDDSASVPLPSRR
jgi:hypothetical protein